MTNENLNRVLSRRQAAAQLGVSYAQVRSLQEQGRLSGTRTSAGWRFDAKDVAALKRVLQAERSAAEEQPAGEHSGEVAAAVFEMLEQGASAIQLVLALRIEAGLAQTLREKYWKFRSNAVLTGTAVPRLNTIAVRQQLSHAEWQGAICSSLEAGYKWAVYRQALLQCGQPELELVAGGLSRVLVDATMTLPVPSRQSFVRDVTYMVTVLEKELGPAPPAPQAEEVVGSGCASDDRVLIESASGVEDQGAGTELPPELPPAEVPATGESRVEVKSAVARMTRNSAAKRLNVSYSRVRTLQDKGVLLATQDEEGVWWFDRHDVEQYAASLPSRDEVASIEPKRLQGGELHARVFETFQQHKTLDQALIACVIELKITPTIVVKLARQYADLGGFGLYHLFLSNRRDLDEQASTWGWSIPWEDSDHAGRFLLAIYRADLDWKAIDQARREHGLPVL